MTRPRFDNAACETLAGCIQEIERNTDAELVMVVRARSAKLRSRRLPVWVLHWP